MGIAIKITGGLTLFGAVMMPKRFNLQMPYLDMNRILQFFKDEFDHWITTHLEGMKYNLERDISKLERAYHETKSERIWFDLEMKRRQLVIVLARLAHYRMKNDR